MGFWDFLRKAPSNPLELLNPEDKHSEISTMIRQIEEEQIMKSTTAEKGKAKAYEEPILGQFSINPDYKEAPSKDGNYNLLENLKLWSRKNIIVNAIINTRVNQVSMFCSPARYSSRGVGYEVRLKDPFKDPTTHEEAAIKRIEDFLQYTGNMKDDYTRDNFRGFIKKIIRDRLIYDKINFELIYDKQGELNRFKAVDASTIYVAVDKEGKEPKGKDSEKFVQVLDRRKVAAFKAKEMAWEVHNPRTDITVGRYGYSELELAMNHLQYHENTELFNARYFAQGGTTRGLLHIKTGQDQSRHALQSFRREWQTMFSGINGAWKIPVISAEDVKFINMTQSSRDMEFERWLNYLINVLCSIYAIDPSEINFPNRGGATGSSGSTLNETSAREKNRISRDKGLEPLLKFIEDAINKYIVSQFGDKYIFTFVGGDAQTEREILETLELQSKVGLTFNDIRKKLGYPPVEGGDVINSGVHVQSLGQIMQEKMMEQQFALQKQEAKQANAASKPAGKTSTPTKEQSEAQQKGMNGDSKNVNGKGTYNKTVGKDGQVKGAKNTNSAKQGGKGNNGETVNSDAKKGGKK
ncbi:terminase small subunit [Bacillus phage SWEP1]|nr:terminase small subunit [Bacillus phage SWEP1]